jgi:hypothetical protein
MPIPIYKKIEYVVQTTTSRTSAPEAEARARKAVSEEYPGYEVAWAEATPSGEFPELGPIGETYQWLVTVLITK